jgi:hypothetical protein
MLLIFDTSRDLYVGELLTVTPEAYDAMVDDLVEGGMDEGEAHARLLDESEWSPDMEGVEALRDWPLCLQCRRPLWPTQTRFCDVVCEAGFYVETRS